MLLASWIGSLFGIRQGTEKKRGQRKGQHQRLRASLCRLEKLEDRTLLAAGSLDTSFDTDGKVTTLIGAGNDFGYSVAIDANGKYVVAGYADSVGGTDFAVARYNDNGSPDTSFSTDGKVLTPIGTGDDFGSSVVIDALGRIIVAGYTDTAGNYDFAVVRYLSDGTLDTTFDGDGKVVTPVGSSMDYGRSVAIDANGKIVVGGHAIGASNDDFAVVRYNDNGSLDTTLGGTGKVIHPIGTSTDRAFSIAIDATNRIVLGGSAHGGVNSDDFAVARLNNDGTPDTTFGGTGKVITAFGAGQDFGKGVALDSIGRIVLAGYTFTGGSNSNDFAVARYNDNGSLDTTFNATGKVITNISTTPSFADDFGESVVIDANGKIIVGGRSWNGSNTDFSLARYNSNGSLDTTFNTTGTVTTAVGIEDQVLDVAIDLEGRIVAAGYAVPSATRDFAIARYEGDGRDFGDANFRTLLPLGARHVAAGPMLGTLRDTETDGQPNATATGDDINGIDDEDGVTGISALALGMPATVTIFVTGGPAKLDAWIDFNDNFQFDESERVTPVGGASVVSGSQTLTFMVSGSAVLGDRFARLRLSTGGGLAPTGPAADGEVEDYTVEIGATVKPPSGMRAWFRAEGDTTDFVGGHNGGTLVNGATFGAGMVGQAFSFNGTNSVSVPDSPDWDFGSGDFSIDLWANLHSFAGTTALVAHDDGSGPFNKWILWQVNGTLQLHLNNPSLLNQTITLGTLNTTPDVWQHIAVTKSSGTYRLYINGIAQAPVVDNTPIPNASAPLTIGEAENNFRLNGLVDELEIFHRALTALEVQSISDADIYGKSVLDFGDAPNGNTSLFVDGARHYAVGPRLGTARDTEANGQPSGLADLDDFNVDDEDGVTFSAFLSGTTGSVNVTVGNTGVPVKLDAWIDFNGNNTFDNPTERITAAGGTEVFAGLNVVNFAVPGNANLGSTYARFRLSSAGGLAPTGYAADGEVEDYYPVNILNGASTISGRKYDDFNGDGSGSGDPGLNNVTIQLIHDANDDSINNDPVFATTTTSGGGLYSFNVPTSGRYFVQEVVPPGYTQTAPGAPGYHTISVSATSTNSGRDFGNFTFRAATISGTKFDDFNGDGNSFQDSGLNGVTIQLVRDANQNGQNDDPVVATTTTANGGLYSFTVTQGTIAGERYFVQEVVPPNYVQTFPTGSGFHTIDNVTTATSYSGRDFGNQLFTLDFGDAPASYGTLLGANGARHEATGPLLGIVRDTEADGFPSETALGDDGNNLDDEDGVITIEPLVGGESVEVRIFVQSPAGPARLDAWIDLDRNGTFDEDDLITPFGTGASVSDGNNFLNFLLPYDVNPGPSFARLRLSTVGGLGPTGPAADGEVEDYAVTLLAPPNGTITGVKYNDLNRSGFQDPEQFETGLQGFRIYVDLNDNMQFDAATESTYSALTDVNGLYSITIPAGNYSVREVGQPENGWVNNEGEFGYFVFVPPEDTAFPANFGNYFVPPENRATISGTKWNDHDADSSRDIDFPPPEFTFTYTDEALSGWTIFVDYNNNGILDSDRDATLEPGEEPFDVTDANGEYLITGITPTSFNGAWWVREELQGGWLPAPGLGDRLVGVDEDDEFEFFDFANYQPAPATVSGYKWEDSDANMIRTDEDGLEGWTIFIDINDNGAFDPGDLFDVTDADGNYTITGVPTGYFYIIEVFGEDQSAYLSSTGDEFVPAPPFADQRLAHQGRIFIPNGGAVTEADYSYAVNFGNYIPVPATVSGYKWDDANANASLDGGEGFLEGWTIFVDVNGNFVFDVTDPFDVTDENGNYTITGVPTGYYNIIEVFGEDQSAYRSSTATPYTLEPPNDDQRLAYQNLGFVPNGGTVTEATNPFVNFGNYIPVPGSISGTKFHDHDGNGFRDGGDDGLLGWRIYVDLNTDGNFDLAPEAFIDAAPFNGMFDPGEEFTDVDEDGHYDGVAEPFDDTNSDGLYTIPNVPAPGFYILREVLQEGWSQSYPQSFFFNYHFVILPNGGNVTGYDFGNFQTVAPTVNGTKWNDVDRDGVFDTNPPAGPPEVGIEGWFIFVDVNNNAAYDAGDPFDITDANGNYTITGVPSGFYYIYELFGPEHIGYVSSNAFPWSAPGQRLAYLNPPINIPANGPLNGVNFGNYEVTRTTVSGVKFNDDNADSFRDVGEEGLEGWTIYVDYNGNGVLDNNQDATLADGEEPFAVTGEDGAYTITDVVPGFFFMREIDPPPVANDWVQSPFLGDRQVTIFESFSNIVNFGNYQPRNATISGTKWNDHNSNFSFDDGEGVLPGFIIYLDVNGNTQFDVGEPNDTTAADGSFSIDVPFPQVTPGAFYSVREQAPGGTIYTGSTVSVNSVYLENGTNYSGFNFGNYEPIDARITGVKWNDLDADGVYDDGEPFLQGWTIYADIDGEFGLSGGDRVDVTDENGAYSLLVPAGSWAIRESQPVGDSRPWQASLGDRFLTVPNDSDLTINFGNFLDTPGTISGTKFEDVNGDSLFDRDEPGLAGFTIYVDFNSSGGLDDGEPFDITDEDGNYTIENVPARQNVYVREVQQTNWSQTTSDYFYFLFNGENSIGKDFGNHELRDYGDAPDSYHTTLASNGPRHSAPAEGPNPLFGVLRDLEFDGFDSVATGDDLNNLDDEDGVTFRPLIIVEGGASSFFISVDGGPSFVNAWIDFNADGDFEDEFEHVVDDADFEPGSTGLGFILNIPGDAVPGFTYARFRISSQAGLSFDGPAPDGEVEDYRVLLETRAEVITGPDAGMASLVKSFEGDGRSVVQSFLAFPGFTGGVRVASGDVNGDGTSDFIVAPGPGELPHVKVFSGADLSLLRSFFAYSTDFTGGVFVAAGDVDGDGFDDILTGSDAGVVSHVKVFSGANLSELHSFFAVAPGFLGGVRVAAGDVNGDGRADIITGAGPGAAPHVKVFDGVDLSVHYDFFAYSPGFPGGVFVAAGDVDGDRLADIITGADAGGAPQVKAFSGENLSELGSFFAYGAGFTGGVRVAVGDVNGDGQADIITGAGPGGGPHVKAFDGTYLSGLTSVLASFFAYSPDVEGGIFVASGDVAGEQPERYDFGDAQMNEATLLSNGAAYHAIGGPYLGSQPDAEADGQATSQADGDDLNGFDDEDGVTIGLLETGRTGTITLHVSGTSGGVDAYVHAWIDMDFNGTFDESDRITPYYGLEVSYGDSELNFFIPANTLVGSTFARFRVTTVGGTFDAVLQSYGFAPDGEVEDYRVNIEQGNAPPVLDGAVAGQAVNDNATISPFSTFTIDDADDPAQTLTVVVTLDDAAKGEFTTGSLGGFIVGPAGTYTFTGVAADAQTAIQGLVFDPTDNRVTPGATETTTFTVTANDGIAPTVSDSTTTVISLSINDDPVLGEIGNRSVNELATLSFTIGATDVDQPPQTLTYSVTGLPGNATLNANTGEFSWTPTEAQGEGTYTGTFSVSDGISSDSEIVQIIVNEVNVAPVLAAIGNRTVNELVTLSFTVSATDDDLPANTLVYSVTGLPGNATLNGSSGAFSWTPTEAQGPATYSATFAVSDGTTSDSEIVQIIVNEVNVAPVLGTIGNKTVNELVTLSFTVSATDDDLPANTLVYSVTGLPGNASLNGSSGEFSWTPTEAQGPGTYTGTFAVTDGTVSDSEIVQIIVNEVNLAPVLGTIGNRSVNELAALSFTVSATDDDLPANTLVYSVTGLPGNASLNSTTGAFSWTPTETQGPGTYTGTFAVSDGTTSDSEIVQIVVNEVNVAPVLAAIGNKTVNESVTLSFTISATDTDQPPQTLTYSALNLPEGATLNSTTGAFSWTPTEAQGPGTYLVTFSVDDGTATDLEVVQIVVNDVNAPPAGLNNTVSINEDATHVFSAGDFGFSDPTDTPPHNFNRVKITTVPGAGALKLSGANVTAGQFITVANINSSLLTFVPVEDASGSPYASFTFQVEDDGGTANGGVNLDQSPNTMQINVVAVADTPSLSTSPASGFEGTHIPLSITAAANDDDNSETLSVTISDVPLDVTLTQGSTSPGSGVWVLSNVTQAQLNNLKLIAPLNQVNANRGFALSVTATATESSNPSSMASVSAKLGVRVTRIDTWRFDLNVVPGSVTEPGYTSTTSGLFDPSLGFGWQSAGVTAVDRGTTNALLRDGHEGSDNVFQAVVPNATWHVTVIMGDFNSARDGITVSAEGTAVTGLNPAPTTAAQQFLSRSFDVAVSDGKLDLRFQDLAGIPNWLVNAIEIRRSPGFVGTLTINGPGTVTADGASVDIYTGSGATPNALITVTTTIGTLTSVDAAAAGTAPNPNYFGTQVQANGAGNFNFTIRRPFVAGAGTITVEETTGAKVGTHSQTYTPPNTAKFDFNTATSPTQLPGYISVLPTGASSPSGDYSPAQGYGWTNTISAVESTATGPQSDLRRDAHQATAARVFQVDLANGTYLVNATMGSGNTTLTNMQVKNANGGATLVAPFSTTAAERFRVQPFEVTVSGNQLALEFSSATAGQTWSLNGLEIRQKSPINTVTAIPLTGPGSVEANGSNISIITGSGLAQGTVVTVSTTRGTITSPDANADYAGIQVIVAANGTFTFNVQAPSAAGTPTLTATTLDAAAQAVVTDGAVLTFTAPLSQRFDFNQGSLTYGPAPTYTESLSGATITYSQPQPGSPPGTPPPVVPVTQSGFLPVYAGTIYNPASPNPKIAANSYGWAPAGGPNTPAGNILPSGTGAPVPWTTPQTPTLASFSLYQDANTGAFNVQSTFQVSGLANGIYGVRLYFGLGNTDTAGIRVRAEAGGAVMTDVTGTPSSAPDTGFYNVPATPLFKYSNSFVFNVTVADGRLDLTFKSNPALGKPWSVDGMDLAFGGLTGGNMPAVAPQAPLRGMAVDAVDETISEADLSPILAAAIARWTASGISTEQAALLAAANVQVANIDDQGLLGVTGTTNILIDDNAAGYGWFVDSTPADDAEFGSGVAPFEFVATTGSAATGMDLLTVVMHELGHVLGLESLDTSLVPHDLMTTHLDTGTRRTPAGGTTAAEVSAASTPVQMGSSPTVAAALSESIGPAILLDNVAGSAVSSPVAIKSSSDDSPAELPAAFGSKNADSDALDSFFTGVGGLSLPDLFA